MLAQQATSASKKTNGIGSASGRVLLTFRPAWRRCSSEMTSMAARPCEFHRSRDAWQRSEFVFQAKQDLKPADSRLAVYFGGTGTLWVSDVAIEPTTAPKSEWFPAIPMPACGNALPNSSFECGGSGWGCADAMYFGCQANVFRLLGERDRTQAFDGKASWKITSPTPPRTCFTLTIPRLAMPVREVVFSHMGWVKVEPGRALRLLRIHEMQPPGGSCARGLDGTPDSHWGGEVALTSSGSASRSVAPPRAISSLAPRCSDCRRRRTASRPSG